MLKKVFLVRNVAPGKYGGGEAYQLKLAKELKKNDFLPIIVTNSRELIKNARGYGFKVLVPPYCKRQDWSGWKNLLLPLYYIFQFRLKMWYRGAYKKYGPAVVNIQSRDDWIAATIAAKEFDINILWTDHADFKNWVLWNVNSRFKNVIGKKIIALSKYVKRVIFISKNVELETKKMIAPKKIENLVVIENGVEDLFDKYAGINEAKNSFVFMGRVTKEKGVGELIEAFKEVSREYTDIELKIYGDGEIDNYEEMCRECKKIKFYSWPHESLKVLAENEIFVLPSYREGLSLSLLDAAMMGKKIIASDVDGNPEVVISKKTGLLVPAKNVEKLAEAMMYMLENKKEAAEMAKSARGHYKENFDFEKIFKEMMLPLYNIEKEEK